MKRLTIIIPIRNGEGWELTGKSLALSTFKNFYVRPVIDINYEGANATRNKGFNNPYKVNTEFVLFSDNDIFWSPEALQAMINCLDKNPKISYAYGAYEMGGRIFCREQFDPYLLRKKNYISTMSIIRTNDFCGFDNNIKRLQDWDLWLTLLKSDKIGKNVNMLIFRTPVRLGITHKNIGITYESAIKEIAKKHGL